ncbi:MAG: hypothetical protein JKX85_10690 [Phycisphaeraceae bacterium]|nr:hypothetical protein [Phycisphaeraceae bacterium]
MAQPGKYIALGIENIGEGKFKAQFDKAFEKIHQELMDFEEKSGDKTGTATLTTKITLSRLKGTEDFAAIQYEFSSRTPTLKHTTNAIMTQGRMLFNPEGDSLNDSDQSLMTFTRSGQKMAAINKDTGEVVEPDQNSDIAGQVGTA